MGGLRGNHLEMNDILLMLKSKQAEKAVIIALQEIPFHKDRNDEFKLADNEKEINEAGFRVLSGLMTKKQDKKKGKIPRTI